MELEGRAPVARVQARLLLEAAPPFSGTGPTKGAQVPTRLAGIVGVEEPGHRWRHDLRCAHRRMSSGESANLMPLAGGVKGRRIHVAGMMRRLRRAGPRCSSAPYIMDAAAERDRGRGMGRDRTGARREGRQASRTVGDERPGAARFARPAPRLPDTGHPWARLGAKPGEERRRRRFGCRSIPGFQALRGISGGGGACLARRAERPGAGDPRSISCSPGTTRSWWPWRRRGCRPTSAQESSRSASFSRW